MDKQTSDTRDKNIASDSTSHYRRIATEGGRNGTKGARTEFSDVVTGTDDKSRTGEAGTAINTANTAKCAWNIVMATEAAAQTTVETTRKYEEQLTAVQHKMTQLEQLVISQRQKNLSLEQQLLTTQDRIGSVGRRARLLENENQKIQGELQFWNEVYQQDTGISHTSSALPSVNQPSVSTLLPAPIPSVSVASVQTALSMEIQISLRTFTTPLSSRFTWVLNLYPGGASYECKQMG